MEIENTETQLMIKFEFRTFTIYIDNYTTIDQLIDNLKIKVFEILKLDIFKIENRKFNFISSNRHRKFPKEQLNLSIFDKSLENFFIPLSTYTVNILSFELPDDPDCLNNLKKIIKFLEIVKNSNSNTQIIISPFSANATDNYYKNILQQFHYDIIEPEIKKIIYLLIDGAFFNDKNKEVYHLLNCQELKLPDMINVKNLKFFTLQKPYINSKTPGEYIDLFNNLVHKKIENKKVLFLILKCKLDTEILEFLKEYKNDFQFRAFLGGEYEF